MRKQKKTDGAKIRAKFETSRRETKADIRKQHDLYLNNFVGDVKANPKDFYRYINSQKKDAQGIPPLKKKNGSDVAQSDSEKAADSMVNSLMCSLNPNTARSRFWIDQRLSWKICCFFYLPLLLFPLRHHFASRVVLLLLD